jgi:hypothetical protein
LVGYLINTYGFKKQELQWPTIKVLQNRITLLF